MATARKSDFDLPTLDDLFSSQAERDEAKLAKIRDIPISEIDDFPEHPFKVRDDEDMTQLIESIKERGVITPATVRLKEDGRYEMISGHRRKRASELAGFDTLRCEVVDLSKEEATILMVESNFQRSQILPSEKAFAYKMRYDAMKNQGKRNDLCNGVAQVKARDILADETGDSHETIRKYIRLTNLVPELLEYVDEGKIKMRPAVEISYLDEDCQRDLVDEIDLNEATMFYRYISENLTNYINEGEIDAGNTDFDYAKMSDEEAEEARASLIEEKGFFMLPSQLFCNLYRK